MDKSKGEYVKPVNAKNIRSRIGWIWVYDSEKDSRGNVKWSINKLKKSVDEATRFIRDNELRKLVDTDKNFIGGNIFISITNKHEAAKV